LDLASVLALHILFFDESTKGAEGPASEKLYKTFYKGIKDPKRNDEMLFCTVEEGYLIHKLLLGKNFQYK
jgi:hypothetical protein